MQTHYLLCEKHSVDPSIHLAIAAAWRSTCRQPRRLHESRWQDQIHWPQLFPSSIGTTPCWNKTYDSPRVCNARNQHSKRLLPWQRMLLGQLADFRARCYALSAELAALKVGCHSSRRRKAPAEPRAFRAQRRLRSCETLRTRRLAAGRQRHRSARQRRDPHENPESLSCARPAPRQPADAEAGRRSLRPAVRATA